MDRRTTIENLLTLKQNLKTENQKSLVDSLINEIETEGFSVQLVNEPSERGDNHLVSEKLRRKVADLSARAFLEVAKHATIGTAIEEFMRLWHKFGD